MFTVGYFPTFTGSSSGGGGATEDLTALKADVSSLKTWRDTVVPAPYRTDTKAWDELITGIEMQAHVGLVQDTLQTQIDPLKTKMDQIQPICFSTDPKDALMTEEQLIMALFGYATTGDLDQAKQRIFDLEILQPVYQKVLQAVQGNWITPSTNSSHVRPNGVYLCDVWSGYAALAENLFMFRHPLEETKPFQFRVVNDSLNNIPLRMYCMPKPDGSKAVFRRGKTQNHTYSCAKLEAGRTLRLVFVPAAYQWFWLNGVAVAGFLEIDEEGDPSRTVLSTNM